MVLHGIDRQLNPIIEVQLFEHCANVIPHGLFAQVQQAADLRIRFATCDMNQYIHLAIRKFTEGILVRFAVYFTDARKEACRGGWIE